MKIAQPLWSILLGLAAGPIVEGYTMLMKYFGLTSITGSESLRLTWSSIANLPWGIPALIQFICLNLVIYYSARFWGADYFPLKSMLMAMTGESLMFNVFGVLAGNQLIVQNVSGNYVHASAAAMGGALTGLLYQKFLYKYGIKSSLTKAKPFQAVLIGYAGWPLMEGLNLAGETFWLDQSIGDGSHQFDVGKRAQPGIGSFGGFGVRRLDWLVDLL